MDDLLVDLKEGQAEERRSADVAQLRRAAEEQRLRGGDDDVPSFDARVPPAVRYDERPGDLPDQHATPHQRSQDDRLPVDNMAEPQGSRTPGQRPRDPVTGPAGPPRTGP
ncbi:hypothetical protein [Ornithinimicrobium sp. LYQ103]|uniref:hypothetical protein n=1 Tax=Ornithinimicrobium sp. LYQ103 TaxID=3378796 RepID=UPI0038545454